MVKKYKVSELKNDKNQVKSDYGKTFLFYLEIKHIYKCT